LLKTARTRQSFALEQTGKQADNRRAWRAAKSRFMEKNVFVLFAMEIVMEMSA
jgi:hypothetical protein